MAQSLEAIEAQDKTIRRLRLSRRRTSARQDKGRCAASRSASRTSSIPADLPTEMGSSIYRGWRPRADASVVMTLKAGRRNHHRQDDHDRVRLVRPDRDAQSAPSRPYARRLVVGLGGCGCGRHDSAGAGHADRRLGDPAGLVLRRGGDQAVLPAAADDRRQMLFVDARHRRAVRGRVEDLARGLAAMTGPPRAVAAGESQSPRIGVVTQDFAGAPDAASGGGTARSRRRLRSAPAHWFVRSPCPTSSPRRGASTRRAGFRGASGVRLGVPREYDAMAPLLRGRLDESKGITPAAYDEAIESPARRDRRWPTIFGEVDVLLTSRRPARRRRGLD